MSLKNFLITFSPLFILGWMLLFLFGMISFRLCIFTGRPDCGRLAKLVQQASKDGSALSGSEHTDSSQRACAVLFQ